MGKRCREENGSGRMQTDMKRRCPIFRVCCCKHKRVTHYYRRKILGVPVLRLERNRLLEEARNKREKDRFLERL